MKLIVFGQKSHEVWAFSDAFANFFESKIRDRGYSHVTQSEDFLRNIWTVWDEAREWTLDREPVKGVYVALDEHRGPVLASIQEDDLREAVSALLSMEPTMNLDVELWTVPN